jgi:hypothetical protein
MKIFCTTITDQIFFNIFHKRNYTIPGKCIDRFISSEDFTKQYSVLSTMSVLMYKTDTHSNAAVLHNNVLITLT